MAFIMPSKGGGLFGGGGGDLKTQFLFLLDKRKEVRGAGDWLLL